MRRNVAGGVFTRALTRVLLCVGELQLVVVVSGGDGGAESHERRLPTLLVLSNCLEEYLV